jgi:dTDP-4-dehydrorhamnose reductase
MKMLITGGNGMVAKAVSNYCRQNGDEVCIYPRSGLDISNREDVLKVFEKDRPQAVINCAAYTDVDAAQENEKACYAANTEGVKNLALASKYIDCRFLTISTDYVFSGEKIPGFYTQKDTPDPPSIYGQAKLEGEKFARDSYARSIIVRTGWIYGDGGTNFLSVMHKLLAEGKRIKAIRDSFGTPTFAGDLAIRLRELVELDLPVTYHITNSGPGASYLGFAEKVCEIGGFDKDLIESITDQGLSRPAPRPQNSRLACLFSEKFGLLPMPDWEDALKRFING